jgi:hypothetical protein
MSESFDEILTGNQAEGVVVGARMAELAAISTHARRQASAARGQLTRALKDGNAERIAAAHARHDELSREAGRIGDACLTEMFACNRRGLDNLGRLMDAWNGADQDAEAGS